MKRTLTAVLAAFLLWQVVPTAFAATENTAGASGAKVAVSAKSVILVERETGTVLYQQAEHEKLEPASVTKVMTMLLVAEAIDAGQISLDDQVTCSAYAASMGGSQVYLEEGEQMSVHDLLKSVAVASGNDAAVVLAEYLAGSEPEFVDKMNQRAKELGMKDTNFCNCNGLPAEGHVTSAYDIALMSCELLRHDMIREYVGTWMDTIRDGEFQLANTNKMIYYYEGATGLKTGSTDGAGFCISASACRDDMELVAVVLGSTTSKERFDSAKALLNYGFGAYALADVTPKEKLTPVEVTVGEEKTVAVGMDQVGKLLVKKDQLKSVTTEVKMVDSLQALVAKGTNVGEIIVSVGEKEVKRIPLVTQKEIPRLTFSGMFSNMWERIK